jgi:hypothetical protein
MIACRGGVDVKTIKGFTSYRDDSHNQRRGIGRHERSRRPAIEVNHEDKNGKEMSTKSDLNYAIASSRPKPRAIICVLVGEQQFCKFFSFFVSWNLTHGSALFSIYLQGECKREYRFLVAKQLFQPMLSVFREGFRWALKVLIKSSKAHETANQIKASRTSKGFEPHQLSNTAAMPPPLCDCRSDYHYNSARGIESLEVWMSRESPKGPRTFFLLAFDSARVPAPFLQNHVEPKMIN